MTAVGCRVTKVQNILEVRVSLHVVIFEFRSVNYNSFDPRVIRATFPSYPFQPQIGGEIVIPFKGRNGCALSGKIVAIEYPAWIHPPKKLLELWCFVDITPNEFNELDAHLKNVSPDEKKLLWSRWSTLKNPPPKKI